MVDTRNAIETAFLVILVGYPEIRWIPLPVTLRIVILTITILPLGVASVMGIDGDSLFQYLGHMISFLFHRRKLHYRRIGYSYDNRKWKAASKKKKED